MNASGEQIIEQKSIKQPLAWLIWGLAVSYVVYKFQTQSSYAVLNASIAESLSLTLLQVGELGAVYAITYAVMTIPAGALLMPAPARLIEDFNVPLSDAALIFPAALLLALILAVIKKETYHMEPGAAA